jgi:hypothetical protein
MIWRWKRTREAKGMSVPAWYLGYGYYDFDRDVLTYYVVPLNLVISVSRWVWEIIQFRLGLKIYQITRWKAYRQGFNAGFAAGTATIGTKSGSDK